MQRAEMVSCEDGPQVGRHGGSSSEHSEMTDISPEVVESYWFNFFEAAAIVSVAALTIYDHAITLDLEVEQIWKKRINLSSLIFIVNRYNLLVSSTENVAFTLFSRTRTSCLGLWFARSVSVQLAWIALSIFFITRTWAIWERHFLPLLVLIPLAVSVDILDAAVAFPTRYGGILSLQTPYGGCFLPSPMSEDVIRRLTDASGFIGVIFSFLVLCGTLAKTLKLWRFASQAGIKGSLVSLLIKDGTIYVCSTLIINMLHVIVTSPHISVVAAFGVIAGLSERIRPIILSRMILDLKSIDQVSMVSLPEIATSRFSSIHFIGNIGAPLNTSFMRENEDEDEEEICGAVSAKQIIDDPLSIGLLDRQYEGDVNIERSKPAPTAEEGAGIATNV
ncbi:hypothetical protein C8Q75DRAFT_756185 [Abortiporus biennis]|nr:hypothetical protein C8Q75DRAFT_756185 [Abortiporus biennis]